MSGISRQLSLFLNDYLYFSLDAGGSTSVRRSSFKHDQHKIEVTLERGNRGTRSPPVSRHPRCINAGASTGASMALSEGEQLAE